MMKTFLLKKQTMNQKQRADIALRVIRDQFPHGPIEQLMFAVISMAVTDAIAVKPKRRRSDTFSINRDSARHYLNSEMEHAGLAGVSAKWIKMVFKKCELDFSIDGM